MKHSFKTSSRFFRLTKMSYLVCAVLSSVLLVSISRVALAQEAGEAPVKRTIRVGDVQPQEEYTIKRRVLSLNTTYFGFGIGGFTNEDVTKTAYDFALGYNWEVTSHAAIRVLAEGAFAGNFKTTMDLGTLGLNYFFTHQDTSPYVGGGLGYGASASSESKATTVGGFAGAVSVGVMLFRTSSTHFDFNLSYSTIFANNTIGSPGLFAFRIGVLY